MASVLIIGSGLLALSIAEKFHANNYKVSISTTTPLKLQELESVGYKPLLFDCNNSNDYDCFNALTTDILIFTLSPSKCHSITYQEVLQRICQKTSKYNLLVFTSSISVYLNNHQNHNEISEAVDKKSAIYQVETFIREQHKQYFIFRLGGLIDQQRHPANFHKTLRVQQAEAPVNLVHIKDVSQIIFESTKQQIKSGVYNVCSPEHPSKKAYYGALNKQLAFEEGNVGKTIDGSLISQTIKVTYSSIFEF